MASQAVCMINMYVILHDDRRMIKRDLRQVRGRLPCQSHHALA